MKNSGSVKKQTPPPKPAASGTGGPGVSRQGHKISVEAPGGKHVGPKGAPYYEKS